MEKIKSKEIMLKKFQFLKNFEGGKIYQNQLHKKLLST